MIDMPPGKYFISHSYKDAAVREKLLAQLPPTIETFIFPPIVAGLGTDSPDFISTYKDMFVQLYHQNGLNNNRIDDLIVRLYWLIFRNQFPELMYE